MAFIRNTDRLIEGSSKLFFSNIRAKAAVQSDLDLLASDISAEESARISEDNGMKLRLDVIEGGAGVSGSIAKAQADAQTYADQKVAALVNSAPEVLDTLKELSDALGGDASFATTVAGQIGDVDAKVDQEILDRQTAISGLESELASEVASLEGQIEAEQLARQSDVSGLDGRLDTLEQDPVTKSYVDSEILELDGLFSSFQGDFDGRLDVIEGMGEGSVAKAEQDAKDYADSLDSAMDARMQVLESDPVTKTYVDGEVSDLQGQITQEISDRQSAISGVQGEVEAEETRAMAAESALSGRLDTLELDPVTQTYVDGEVSDLQGQVNTEKGRIDAILSASEADKDSFAEIVSLINSVDTTNDTAFAGYVLSNDAALAQEVSDREAGDSALDARLDVLEGLDSVEGSVAKAEKDAKDYADSLNSAMDSRVDALEADPVTKTYVDSEVSALESADSTLQGNIDGLFASKTTSDLAEGSRLYYTQARFDSAFAGKSSTDLAEGSKLFFTDARARSASVVNSSAGSQTDQAMSVSSAKSYIDAADNARLRLDGSTTMTGALNFSSTVGISQGGASVISAAAGQMLVFSRGMRVPYLGVSGNSTLGAPSSYITGVTSTAAPRVITLPAASSMGAGRMLVVKDESGAASTTNYIRIQGSGGQTIDGDAYYDIVVPYESVMIYTNGTNWFII